jgi:thioester reductase-like protein
LDPTIQFPHPIVTNISRPGKIFLTGATGLLGANLLGEFLRNTGAVVYCLVRSKGIDDGRTRLRQRLQFYALWNQSFESRIVPLVGDLEQPRFGLSETQFRTLAESADVIYHCGANVNLLYPYKRLKAVNVLGTQEVLRLAGQFRTKPVHYISTLALFSPRGDGSGKKRVVLETEHPDHDGTLNSGYLKTKMVSEQLIQNAKERGLPACIYRTVRIIGQSDTGIMGSVGDMICLSWRGCVLIERSPVVERKLNLIPVDFASHAIAHLSRKPESMGRVFHISNPQTVSWAEIFEATRAFGYLVEPISYDQWLETIVERAQMTHDRDKKETMEMMALAHFAPKLFSRSFNGTFDMRQTLEGLLGTSIACPTIGDRVLRAYIAFFEESGFFPPARAKANIVEYWRRLSEARRVSRVKLLASSLASNAEISEECKCEAVRLAETTNRSAVEIAREFGVPLHEFYAWRKHFKQHRSTRTSASYSGGTTSSLHSQSGGVLSDDGGLAAASFSAINRLGKSLSEG